jgi:glycosyltransferase involved in cell wall biosynthesis
MKRILIVAYYYPPVATSGAMRPLAFSRLLPEHGWLPSVLTIDPRSAESDGQVDPQLLERIPPEVTVLRVPYVSPVARLVKFRNGLRDLFGVQAVTGAAAVPQGRSLPTHSVRIRDHVLERLWGFPDVCAPWQMPAIRAAKRAFQRDPPDVVLATAPPWTSLVLGHRLSVVFGVPLVLDFRDPWTMNPVRRTHSAWAESKATLVEAKLVRQASLIVANTPESMQQLASRYPEAISKLRTITNGFDPGAMTTTEGAEVVGGPLELCHFGTIYGQRSPHQLLIALKSLNDRAHGTLAARLRVRFIGDWEGCDGETETVVRTLEDAGLVRRERPLPHALCLEAMRRATMLLVLQTASPVQVPGKLYEYIAMGRPILLVGGEGATSALIERHDLGLCAPNLSGDIAALLQEIVDQPDRLTTPSLAQLEQFDYRVLSARLAQELDALTCRSLADPHSGSARRVRAS